jgi:zinc transporter 7
LIVVADALHNLTDGLAIGTSFRIDPMIGVASATSIFSHELAHEIGDFV